MLSRLRRISNSTYCHSSGTHYEGYITAFRGSRTPRYLTSAFFHSSSKLTRFPFTRKHRFILGGQFSFVKYEVSGSWGLLGISLVRVKNRIFPRKTRGSGLLGLPANLQHSILEGAFSCKIRGSGLLAPLGNFLGRSPLLDPSSGPPLVADFGPFWSENFVKHEVFKKSEAERRHH